MKCVCPMGGDRVCPEDCPVPLLARAFDHRAERLINRRLSEHLTDEKDLEFWARQQTWQHAAMVVRALLEGTTIYEH